MIWLNKLPLGCTHAELICFEAIEIILGCWSSEYDLSEHMKIIAIRIKPVNQ